ncbi:MAG: hypothetical protein ABMA13_02925 [Chthoniobacteraceae bacterium]
MAEITSIPTTYTRSQEAFLKSAEEIQQLVRSVLRDERDVMHLRRRPEIHQKILDHVKRIVR